MTYCVQINLSGLISTKNLLKNLEFRLCHVFYLKPHLKVIQYYSGTLKYIQYYINPLLHKYWIIIFSLSNKTFRLNDCLIDILDFKVEGVFSMVVVSILPHAEFGRSDQGVREDAPHCIKCLSYKTRRNSHKIILYETKYCSIFILERLFYWTYDERKIQKRFIEGKSRLSHDYLLNWSFDDEQIGLVFDL